MSKTSLTLPESPTSVMLPFTSLIFCFMNTKDARTTEEINLRPDRSRMIFVAPSFITFSNEETTHRT